MEMKNCYTRKDCIEDKTSGDIRNAVIVIDKQALPEGETNQLYYCTGKAQSVFKAGEQYMMLTSLANGVSGYCKPDDVLGRLRPDLLPDTAKLQLSQIRPEGALDLNEYEPMYSGYSFLPDGSYGPGVWLANEKEVMAYVEMQKPYQYRIMICDRDDFCVLEMREQELIYPSREEMEDYREQKAASGGMEMT